MMNLHDEKWLEFQIKILEEALEISVRNNKEGKQIEYRSELEILKKLREQKSS